LKIGAVVVTFNRKKLLLRSLNALREQTYPLDAIFIIDGPSTDGTPEALKDYGYIKEIPPTNYSYNDYSWETKNVIKSTTNTPIKIHYVRLYEDVGGAGGFHEGIKRAYEEGYDWIWIMDDDILPAPTCLENLIKYSGKNPIVIPLRLSVKGGIEEYAALKINLNNPFVLKWKIHTKEYFKNIHDMPEVIRVEDFSFEGPLIKRKIISSVGFPQKNMFIFGDDTEYALRIQVKTGVKPVLVRDAIMYRMILHKKISYRGLYFRVRNTCFIMKKYGKNTFVKTIRPLLLSGRIAVAGIVKGKIKMTKIAIIAYVDFLKGVFPKRKF